MRPIHALLPWLVAVLVWCGELPSLDRLVARLVEVESIPPAATMASLDTPIAVEPETSERAERTRLMLRVAELEAEVARSREEAREGAAVAERYRRGLERAVGELNRRQRPSLASSRPPRSPRRRAPASPVASPEPIVADAELTMIGDQVLVHGRMRNPRRERVVGTLRIELLHDGQVVAVERTFFEIAAGGTADYRHRFRYILIDGTLSARAVLDA